VAALLRGAGGARFLGDLIVALGPEKFVGGQLVPALGGDWCARTIRAAGTRSAWRRGVGLPRKKRGIVAPRPPLPPATADGGAHRLRRPLQARPLLKARFPIPHSNIFFRLYRWHCHPI